MAASSFGILQQSLLVAAVIRKGNKASGLRCTPRQEEAKVAATGMTSTAAQLSGVRCKLTRKDYWLPSLLVVC